MPTLSRRTLLSLSLAAPALLVASRPALAREPEIYSENGIAIDGSDPVAYFDNTGPIPGGTAHVIEWKGAEWRFSNAENAENFRTDPDSYAPEFGGYCAYAASLGYLAPTMPEAWTIYEDKLYLNANLRARELWLQDVPGNIAKGRANWPAILG